LRPTTRGDEFGSTGEPVDFGAGRENADCDGESPGEELAVELEVEGGADILARL
jgi:hypothetical protein